MNPLTPVWLAFGATAIFGLVFLWSLAVYLATWRRVAAGDQGQFFGPLAVCAAAYGVFVMAASDRDVWTLVASSRDADVQRTRRRVYLARRLFLAGFGLIGVAVVAWIALNAFARVR